MKSNLTEKTSGDFLFAGADLKERAKQMALDLEWDPNLKVFVVTGCGGEAAYEELGEVYAFLDGYYLARKRFGNLDVPDWHDPGRTPGNYPKE
jgi:hypothetical protein